MGRRSRIALGTPGRRRRRAAPPGRADPCTTCGSRWSSSRSTWPQRWRHPPGQSLSFYASRLTPRSFLLSWSAPWPPRPAGSSSRSLSATYGAGFPPDTSQTWPPPANWSSRPNAGPRQESRSSSWVPGVY